MPKTSQYKKTNKQKKLTLDLSLTANPPNSTNLRYEAMIYSQMNHNSHRPAPFLLFDNVEQLWPVIMKATLILSLSFKKAEAYCILFIDLRKTGNHGLISNR